MRKILPWDQDLKERLVVDPHVGDVPAFGVNELLAEITVITQVERAQALKVDKRLVRFFAYNCFNHNSQIRYIFLNENKTSLN